MSLRTAVLLVLACLAFMLPDGRAVAQEPADAEKLRLILKDGADPNARDQSGYTVLARLLFDQNREIRRVPKLDLVRLLIDAGANVNGDHGGWGRAGALGLALREEPEVIALLVARGATLTATDRGGPIATAIEMERDDLALALLGRDRKVGPQDRAALPLAARRGWRHVVTALLQAGADANAADAQGTTALALAERRRDASMTKALLAAGARPSARPAPAEIRPATNFAAAAAREIDEVVFFDPPRFALTAASVASFAFYGEAMNQFKEVKCERSASFEFIAQANLAGGIRVGICAREARRVRALAAAAQPALEGVLGQLSQGGVKLEPAMLDKAGWKYARKIAAGGAEEHYFPLIAVGHGIAQVSTLVRIPRGARRAIVVQADTMRLCEGYGLNNQTALCSDTRQALADIARRLDSRFVD